MVVNQPSASSFKQVVTLREAAPFCLSIAALSQHNVGRHCATLAAAEQQSRSRGSSLHSAGITFQSCKQPPHHPFHPAPSLLGLQSVKCLQDGSSLGS